MSGNVADILGRHAGRTPDAPAVIERGRTWTYAGFDRAVWRAAGALRKLGIAPGDVVGVTLPTSALYLAIAYALARIGAIHLTLSAREPSPARRALAARFRAATVIDERSADPGWLEDAHEAQPAVAAVGGHAPWKIVVTSGTTGKPKATLHTHAMQLERFASNQAAVPAAPSDRYLVLMAMDLEAGLRHCLFLHYAGAAVMIDGGLESTEEFFDAVERTQATYLSLAPVHLERLVAAAPAPEPRLPRVRILRSGGMVHSQALCAEVRRRLSPNLFVMYGTNDGASPLTCLAGDDLERHPGALGFPCPGIEAQATDEGLLRFRGPGFPSEYIDDPEATAKYFRDGWYYPGDVGSITADGLIRFKGRADDMMNYDGVKVYPAEIENVLLENPAVAEAAAFAIASRAHQDVPAAAVVLRSGASASELLRYSREKLGARAPTTVLVLKALPRNAFGKVDRKELARLVLARAARTRA